jgi:iron complex outermembrane receptor protein
MNTRKFILIFCFFVCSFSGFSQEMTITGVVTSADDGLGIPGASIYVKGTVNGTITDFEGAYQISGVKSSDTLVFHYLGFIDVLRKVGAEKIINVALVSEAQNLDEVVVTALGIKREKREIGYTTESFEGDDLKKSNAPNMINALSGRSAGVQVTEADGVEGGTTRITIRGNNNITGNNQPLIVVDGVPLENDPGLTQIGRGQDWGSAINNVNQADIADMSILKGATASALYGSRGANGVILITTKRGKKQKGIGINYSFSQKFITPYRFREVQNTYGAGGPLTLSEPTFQEDSTGTYI